jgi:tRNA A37 methylthiotransferase MiaB
VQEGDFPSFCPLSRKWTMGSCLIILILISRVLRVMKVLLIQPPIRDFYETSIRTQPIGLAYLAGSLQSSGFEVDILDCRQKKKTPVPLSSELSYLRDFYPFEDRGPFKLYSGYYHYGMGWGEIAQKVAESGADVFGISSSFTPYHQEALEVARIIKAWDRKKIVVMGGAHVSCDPESVVKDPWVDYAVLGEGEVRFPELLHEIKKGAAGRMDQIDGIGYRKEGEIRITPPRRFITDLDALPYPAREFFCPEDESIQGLRSTMILTSRGCPHRCAYCSAHLLMGTAFRARSPEKIVEEMEACQRKYGTRVFDIEDDNFTFERERAKRLMKLIIETFGERGLKLTAMNGVSFASLDRELLRLMKKAGFDTVNLSLVSTDRTTKERMGRPKAASSFDTVLGEVEAAGLRAVVYGIFGMPGQTLDEMVDTLIYLMGKRVLIGPSIYYPTPGTPLFERCRVEGMLPLYPAQWRSSAFPIETGDFNRVDLVTLFRLTRAINFIKGRMDKAELDEGATWEGLLKGLRDRSNAGAGGQEGTLMTEPSAAWRQIVWRLYEERSFFGLKKGAEGKEVLFREKTSTKVLDYFFEKGWTVPVLGTC